MSRRGRRLAAGAGACTFGRSAPCTSGAKTPQFGNPGHTNIPLAGDFDGDGKSDIAIYDQTDSKFFILLSGGGAKTPQFGNPAHKNIPVVGDFDGDGKADTAIYDQTLAQFFILESGGGALVPTLGNPGHINLPVPSVYVPRSTHTASIARAGAPPAGGNVAVAATAPRVALVAVITKKDER